MSLLYMRMLGRLVETGEQGSTKAYIVTLTDKIAELEKDNHELVGLAISTSARLHLIRTDLEFNEVQKSKTNEKIRLAAIHLAEKAKALKESK